MAQHLSDQTYAEYFNRLLELIQQGWTSEQLVMLWGDRLDHPQFVDWLRREWERQLLLPQVDRNWVDQLLRLGVVGAIGEMAVEVAEQILSTEMTAQGWFDRGWQASEKEQYEHRTMNGSIAPSIILSFVIPLLISPSVL
jgi:hypothetical protein